MITPKQTCLLITICSVIVTAIPALQQGFGRSGISNELKIACWVLNENIGHQFIALYGIICLGFVLCSVMFVKILCARKCDLSSNNYTFELSFLSFP